MGLFKLPFWRFSIYPFEISIYLFYTFLDFQFTFEFCFPFEFFIFFFLKLSIYPFEIFNLPSWNFQFTILKIQFTFEISNLPWKLMLEFNTSDTANISKLSWNQCNLFPFKTKWQIDNFRPLRGTADTTVPQMWISISHVLSSIFFTYISEFLRKMYLHDCTLRFSRPNVCIFLDIGTFFVTWNFRTAIFSKHLILKEKSLTNTSKCGIFHLRRAERCISYSKPLGFGRC